MTRLESAWDCQIQPAVRREIPPDVMSALSKQDSVENLTDALKEFGLESCIEFPAGTMATESFGVRVGQVLTLRYVPKRIRSQDNRLGHDLIAKTLKKGDILIADQRDCVGGIAGGNALGKMFGAGAEALIVDGAARDYADAGKRKAPVICTRWGIASGKTTIELVNIGAPINFNGTVVHSTDVAVVNRWGMVLVPPTVAWNDLLAAAGLT